MPETRPLFVLPGSHLFAPEHLRDWRHARIVMAEDLGLCTEVRHHQQKIAMFLAAMRHHRDELEAHGFDVRYTRLEEPGGETPYEEKLERHLREHPAEELVSFEIEDRPFAARIDAFAAEHGLRRTILPSPMFLTPRAEFAAYLADARGKPFMARFYQRQRQRLGILLDAEGGPEGGRWSFDEDNRRKLPRGIELPETPAADPTPHLADVIPLVRERFAEHPGDAADTWLPVTREAALAWLDRFLRERFADFGAYEDAMSRRDHVLFHSVLSPMMNMGLLTPAECVDRALEHAATGEVPLNSLEGFVRQIIGWREFIRGIDEHFGDEQHQRNFWNAERRLTEAWFTGDTGLDPLDHVIRTARRWGWTHHIERLMVAGNLLTLCGVHPHEAHAWFMSMYVDSAHWVMGPNVYGMGIFSDGGIFATKPYICGSNYILKMSDESKGPWCEIMDGLYWGFIARHRPVFESNHRLSMMPRMLDKLDPDRRTRIIAAGEAFIDRVTRT